MPIKLIEPPVPREMMPKHIAVVMDGNGRWAKKRGMPRKLGHIQGARAFRKMIIHSIEIGLEYLSFYAFSTENWKRPDDEVHGIMNLMSKYLSDARTEFGNERVRLILLGDNEAFDPELKQKFTDLQNDTKDFRALTAGCAANYGARDEIVHAAKALARKVQEGTLSPEDITEEMISQNLYTKDMPDVDLLIRPGGEQRISNFLLWQSAYAELYFCDTLWPDFGPEDFDKAIVEYAKRTRRFGGV